MIIHGDALEELRKLEDNSVDAIVCDPPAGISFMNKEFDRDRGGRDHWVAWLRDIMAEALRVLKNGGHALVWSLPRTSHWTALALEDAGFEIRDSIYHLYGVDAKVSAFYATLSDEQRNLFTQILDSQDAPSALLHCFGSGFPKSLNLGDGRGTALKPSVENWWLCRKPLAEKSVAANVLKYGTGALNIDASRVKMSNADRTIVNNRSGRGDSAEGWGHIGTRPNGEKFISHSFGRFPSHLLLSHTLLCTEAQCAEGCPVAALDEQSGISKSTDNIRRNNAHVPNAYGSFNNPRVTRGHNDQGGASRYFQTFRPVPFIYSAKASRKDRNSNGAVNNTHPTTKSQQLMRTLVRMICPPGGICLDMFGGSGSTALACISEGFRYIIIEKELEYIEIIRARVAHAEAKAKKIA